MNLACKVAQGVPVGRCFLFILFNITARVNVRNNDKGGSLLDFTDVNYTSYEAADQVGFFQWGNFQIPSETRLTY